MGEGRGEGRGMLGEGEKEERGGGVRGGNLTLNSPSSAASQPASQQSVNHRIKCHTCMYMGSHVTNETGDEASCPPLD